MATRNKFRGRIKKDTLIKKSISILLPVYNEKDIIRDVVKDTLKFLKEKFEDYEIVIVESGSNDGTKEIVDMLKEENKGIIIYHQARKEGLGSALIEGFKRCDKDITFYMDSDMPFNLEDILKAFPYIYDYDCVIGYKQGKRENITRVLYSKFYNLLIKTLFRVNVKDVNFSFKMFKTDVIKNINLISKGWFIDAEILIELRKNKKSIYQIPIQYTLRSKGKSKVGVGYKTILGIFKEMFSYIKK